MPATVTDTARTAFEAALDEDPTDSRRRAVYADWLDENGDQDGRAYRWLADHAKWPTQPGEMPLTQVMADCRDQWNWWFDAQTNLPLHARLPKAVMIIFAVTGSLVNGFMATTRRQIEANFCAAFHAAVGQGWNPDEKNLTAADSGGRV